MAVCGILVIAAVCVAAFVSAGFGTRRDLEGATERRQQAADDIGGPGVIAQQAAPAAGDVEMSHGGSATASGVPTGTPGELAAADGGSPSAAGGGSGPGGSANPGGGSSGSFPAPPQLAAPGGGSGPGSSSGGGGSPSRPGLGTTTRELTDRIGDAVGGVHPGLGRKIGETGRGLSGVVGGKGRRSG